MFAGAVGARKGFTALGELGPEAFELEALVAIDDGEVGAAEGVRDVGRGLGWSTDLPGRSDSLQLPIGEAFEGQADDAVTRDTPLRVEGEPADNDDSLATLKLCEGDEGPAADRVDTGQGLECRRFDERWL